jgi:type IV secretory pathway protease TraF
MRLLAPLAVVALVTVSVAVGTAQSRALDRGAVVLVKDNQSRLYVKSVLAVPDDVVSISDGRATVNGTPVTVRVDGVTQWGPRQLRTGQYFVAGDPLQVGSGARHSGILESSYVVGTVQPLRP